MFAKEWVKSKLQARRLARSPGSQGLPGRAGSPCHVSGVIQGLPADSRAAPAASLARVALANRVATKVSAGPGRRRPGGRREPRVPARGSGCRRAGNGPAVAAGFGGPGAGAAMPHWHSVPRAQTQSGAGGRSPPDIHHTARAPGPPEQLGSRQHSHHLDQAGRLAGPLGTVMLPSAPSPQTPLSTPGTRAGSTPTLRPVPPRRPAPPGPVGPAWAAASRPAVKDSR